MNATDSTIITSTNGSASYSYSSSGTYFIKTRANLTSSQYIERTDSVTVSFSVNNTGYTTPLNYPNYTLSWNDEFNGTLLSNDWTHELGNGNNGWGNNELQYYREQNTSLENGYLKITAKQEYYGGKNYTSSRIKTQGNVLHTYGRIDIRAKLPFGQGIWPALWMLGDNFPSVGWPSCGEIDIMEMIGGNGYNDRTVHGTAHWESNGHAEYGGSNSLSSGRFADEFHVFSIIWTSSSIVWLRDDIQYQVIDITNLSAFHNNFFFILNLAVGGNWPGSPNASTIFDQTLLVDYIRVFQ
jgi:beta-glucanase (GH16 family)